MSDPLSEEQSIKLLLMKLKVNDSELVLVDITLSNIPLILWIFEFSIVIIKFYWLF